jgi:hypothetical protein
MYFGEDGDYWNGTISPDAAEPSGLRIHYADGTVAECAIARDPDVDPGGCPQHGGHSKWIAVPALGMRGPRPGDRFTADVMPPGTDIYFTH